MFPLLFKIPEDKKFPKVIWQSHTPEQASAIIPVLTGDPPEATSLICQALKLQMLTHPLSDPPLGDAERTDRVTFQRGIPLRVGEAN